MKWMSIAAIAATALAANAEPDHVLEGRVWRVDGQPAAWARMLAMPVGDEPMPLGLDFFMDQMNHSESIFADATGRFQVSAPTGQFVLVATTTDRSELAITTGVREVRLQPLMRVTGHIESSRPELFAGRHLHAFLGSPCAKGVKLMAKTNIDAQGRFTLTGLLPGRLVFNVQSEPLSDMSSLMYATCMELTPTMKEITLGARHPGQVRGRVLGFEEASKGGLLQLSAKPGNSDTDRRATPIDAEGRYEFIDVPAGDFTVSFYGVASDGQHVCGSRDVHVADSTNAAVADFHVARVSP